MWACVCIRKYDATREKRETYVPGCTPQKSGQANLTFYQSRVAVSAVALRLPRAGGRCGPVSAYRVMDESRAVAAVTRHAHVDP